MRTIYDLIQTFEYVAVGLYGEHLQDLARMHERNYDWMQGHLSDIGLAGQFTCYGILLFGDSKWGKAASALAVPTALAIEEFMPITNDRTFDPQDILCYFAGAAIAYAASEVAASKKVRNFFSNIPQRFNSKKTLEEQI